MAKVSLTSEQYSALKPEDVLPSGPPYYGYTKQEYESMISQGAAPKCPSSAISTATPIGTPTTPATTPYPKINPETGKPYTDEEFSLMVTNIAEEAGVTMPSGEFIPAGGAVSPTTTPTTPTTPVFGAGAAAAIPTPEVTPAPPYKPSPELQAWQEEYGAKLTDWVKAEGYGIPKETQALMIQQQTDTLKAREQENIRVMRNNMERRGITNSGYIDANMHMITSNTSVAIAGAIADVQIKSALLKMASFEKAMGSVAQFLGFLSEQSELAYAPEFATWQAEQLATMQTWQGKLDIYKMELNQAYQTQNIDRQGYWNEKLQREQNQFNLRLTEMEIEANQKAAKAEGTGNLLGIILGGIFSFLPGS